MLLVMANHYMTRKDGDKVIDSAGKLVTLMNAKPKPQGLSGADWANKRKQMLGVTYIGLNRILDADKSLKTALPLVKDTPDLLAPALVHLRLANFKLRDWGAKPDKARIADALRYSQEGAAMNSA